MNQGFEEFKGCNQLLRNLNSDGYLTYMVRIQLAHLRRSIEHLNFPLIICISLDSY